MSTNIYYPQINSNYIITQTPYPWGFDLATIVQDLEVGVRYAFPTRGAALTGFPTGPLWKFGVNYSNITDDEVNTIFTFFQAMRGRYGVFRLLDPGGNLLQFSEDFTRTYWDKTLTVGSAVKDPFGQMRAYGVSAGAMLALIGASDGLMQNFVVCSSIWVQGPVVATIGIKDETTSNIYSSTFNVPAGWVRISSTNQIPTDNQMLFYLNLSTSCSLFGAQVSPMKGEGAYVEVPGNYGYHKNVRFDTDAMDLNIQGPNHNGLALPMEEFWVNA